MARDARRPADNSTNSKTAAVPSAALQPGVTGPVNPTRAGTPGPTGPVPTRSITRRENLTTRLLRRQGKIS